MVGHKWKGRRTDRAKGIWIELFLEYLVAALAEGVVAALGWFVRKVYRRVRRKTNRTGPQSKRDKDPAQDTGDDS